MDITSRHLEQRSHQWSRHTTSRSLLLTTKKTDTKQHPGNHSVTTRSMILPQQRQRQAEVRRMQHNTIEAEASTSGEQAARRQLRSSSADAPPTAAASPRTAAAAAAADGQPRSSCGRCAHACIAAANSDGLARPRNALPVALSTSGHAAKTCTSQRRGLIRKPQLQARREDLHTRRKSPSPCRYDPGRHRPWTCAVGQTRDHSTVKFGNPLHIGKSPRLHNATISGAVHAQTPRHRLGAVCQALAVRG